MPPNRPPARRGASPRGGGPVRPVRRRRPRRRAVLGWLLGLVAAGFVLAAGGFAAAYALVEVPDPNALADAQVSTVYYADGTTELGTFAARNRENVTIDQVPDHVQKAILAAEDRSFYENRGVSPTGIARALWTNLTDGTSQGGSTLTQQYVKNYYLTDEHSYTRKFKEFFISLKIDQQQTKDETLVNYLNTVYFGRGAYGVQAAAQAYFGVDAGQLDVSQGALLAALLKGPSNYDPRKGETQAANAAERVDYVLDGMVSQGWLSAADRAAAGLPETIENTTDDNQWRGTNGYLLKTVEDELTGTVGLTEEDVERGGLKIVTTFDPKAQAAAVEAVQDQLPSKLPQGFHVALSAIDPATGGVTAMYGGADYLATQYNDVTQARAQPGSTFKPFALVAGLEKGISLRTTFNGANGQEVDGNRFRNFGDESFGRIDLVTATEHSVNTVYAQLNDRVTPAATRDAAVAAGYPEDTPGISGDQYISNVLGTSAPHPIDVTQAYATFAAQGKRTQWHTIASIDDATGTRTYTASPTTTQAFDSDVAADTTYALEQVVNSGTGSYAKRLNRPAAGKTGTTNDNLAAWFAGFTPDLAASVALFQTSPDGTKNVSLDLGGREVTGGSYPVRIWTAFMRAALDGTPKSDFPDRANVGVSRGSSSTSTSSSSSSSSPTSTSTSTATATATDTPTDSPTGTPSDSPTGTPTGTPTGSATSSATGGSTGGSAGGSTGGSSAGSTATSTRGSAGGAAGGEPERQDAESDEGAAGAAASAAATG
ncbi:transglycosylase domain-containing protein [Kineococcus sp. SYSU DK001]|uniref:transglycosylase domain-containing protein n=1 Tax=Kineococcus sp. SYSU DK001 TaxID=3383122 RepID=UPI003D7E7A8B